MAIERARREAAEAIAAERATALERADRALRMIEARPATAPTQLAPTRTEWAESDAAVHTQGHVTRRPEGAGPDPETVAMLEHAAADDPEALAEVRRAAERPAGRIRRWWRGH